MPQHQGWWRAGPQWAIERQHSALESSTEGHHHHTPTATTITTTTATTHQSELAVLLRVWVEVPDEDARRIRL